MKKIKFSKSALVFYIMTVISLGVCIYTFYNVTVYIQSLVTAGQLSWSANIGDIFGYYVNNAFVYIVYTFIFVGIGYIITLLKNKGKNEIVEIMDEAVDEFNEEEKVEVIENPEMNTEEEIKA